MVAAAIAARDRAIAENAEIDEFWCVFDVECPVQHPGLSDVARRAEQEGIGLAVSNPCFELWLALHFKDHTGWLTTEAACKLRRRLDKSKDKGLDPSRYLPLRRDAWQRAEQLDRTHDMNDRLLPDNNPSSGMHRLLAAIETPSGTAG